MAPCRVSAPKQDEVGSMQGGPSESKQGKMGGSPGERVTIAGERVHRHRSNK